MKSKSRHLRSVRQAALRLVLTRARGTPGEPGHIPQRPFAEHIKRSQPWVSQIESLQRRCDVLEFIDFADSLYEDRLELYRQLVELAPRRFRPMKKTKPNTPKSTRGRSIKKPLAK